MDNGLLASIVFMKDDVAPRFEVERTNLVNH